uniref:Dipeptidyl-peptidase V n=1 Tax=Mycena chlorophos TaxID=658473 RepID=A0ABQ0LMK6_MYCCL|nr:dipeptidyl-peptidase 5 [Mycena chlorophos]
MPPPRNISTNFALKTGADVFSPEVLIEMGRPGTGVANQLGDLALTTYSKYSLKDKKNNKSVYLVPLESTANPLQIPLPNGGELFWLNSRTLGHAVEADGKLNLYAVDLKFETELTNEAPALVGTFPTASATNFVVSDGILVFSDSVYADGDLTTAKEQDEAWEKRGNTALVYDTTYERHWDTWQGPKTSSLFTVALEQGADGKWTLGSTYNNLLRGTGHSAPVEPFGGTDDFSVSGTSVLYTTKDPVLPKGWHTRQNIYLVSTNDPGNPQELTSGKQGATHSPVLNADATKAAWLEMAEDGYEADKNNIVIYDLAAWLEMAEDGYEADKNNIVIYDLVKNVRFKLIEQWDRSPDSISFSQDGKLLYLTVGDNARVKLFALPVPPTPKSESDADFGPRYHKPVVLVKSGAVSGVQPLTDGRLLFSRSSLASPNDLYVIRNLRHFESELVSSDSVEFKGSIEQVSHFTEDELDGKDLDKGSDFWFKGALDKDIHGWILKPKGFKKSDNKKWPAVLLIHGGPQSAWEDQWSNRWNPNIFAQQGYFVVAINPTGSTTFGQELTDAIAKDWGGKPFVDMINGWKYVLDSYPQIDTDRLVGAGASWGGYAINWIQGHPEYGFNFKALVCHDGVFDSTYNGYSTEELYFFNHEWGRPWEPEAKKLLAEMSPHEFVHKWSTPQLFFHGSKDYRLAETESIGGFHALQQLGVPTRLIVFPNENHWVLNHGNSLKWHYELFRWFDEFVGIGE